MASLLVIDIDLIFSLFENISGSAMTLSRGLVFRKLENSRHRILCKVCQVSDIIFRSRPLSCIHQRVSLPPFRTLYTVEPPFLCVDVRVVGCELRKETREFKKEGKIGSLFFHAIKIAEKSE